MQILREWWNAFRNFAIFVSFITNFVLLVVLAIVGQQLFTIKNGIAEPLIDGLHSNFVGLSEARIVTTINVQDEIPIAFNQPVQITAEQGGTDVTLVEDVQINNMPASFFIFGQDTTLRGLVSITLPAGTTLPVTLDLNIPIDQQIPINLNVPVDIYLDETQLSEPFSNLEALFVPLVRGLDNLPSRWADVPSFAIKAVRGEENLLEPTEGSENAWTGFQGLQYPGRRGLNAEGVPPEGEPGTPTVGEPSAPTTEGEPVLIPSSQEDEGIILPTPVPGQ